MYLPVPGFELTPSVSEGECVAHKTSIVDKGICSQENFSFCPSRL